MYSSLQEFIKFERKCPVCDKLSTCTGWRYVDPKFVVSYECPTHRNWNLAISIEDIEECLE